VGGDAGVLVVSVATQLSMPLPVAGLAPVDAAIVNRCLIDWGHYLGPCKRPFRQQGWGLEVDGALVSVAMSASAVSATVAGFGRGEVVELARLCSRPGDNWATRVMLRLWREVAATRWPCWPVRCATAYSQNDRHDGRVYRFDGWERVTTSAGSSGGGAWSRKRYAGDAAHGPKTLWRWRYEAMA
jgi:antitoxin VapB